MFNEKANFSIIVSPIGADEPVIGVAKSHLTKEVMFPLHICNISVELLCRYFKLWPGIKDKRILTLIEKVTFYDVISLLSCIKFKTSEIRQCYGGQTSKIRPVSLKRNSNKSSFILATLHDLYCIIHWSNTFSSFDYITVVFSNS